MSSSNEGPVVYQTMWQKLGSFVLLNHPLASLPSSHSKATAKINPLKIVAIGNLNLRDRL